MSEDQDKPRTIRLDGHYDGSSVNVTLDNPRISPMVVVHMNDELARGVGLSEREAYRLSDEIAKWKAEQDFVRNLKGQVLPPKPSALEVLNRVRKVWNDSHSEKELVASLQKLLVQLEREI